MPAELLTAHFYNWEVRGRGWQLYDAPVPLEPPYRPFHRNGLLQQVERPSDDGRIETFGSGIVSFLKRIVGVKTRPPTSSYAQPDEPVAPYNEDAGAPRSALRVVLPEDTDISREAAEQLLLSLSTCASPVSFEIVGTAQTVSLQVTCTRAARDVIRQAIAAYFPAAIIEEPDDVLVGAWQSASGTQGFVVDLGLSNEFMRPVRTFSRFDVDPLIAVIAALSDLRRDEVATLQVLFQSCRHSWAPCILRAVSDGTGHAFFADAPEMLPLAKEKISRPLCAVRIRVAAKCGRRQREEELVRGVVHALSQLADPSSNEFIPLTNERYDDDEHDADLLARTGHRSGMILNTAELVSLVHLPSASVRSPKLDRERRKTKAAPSTVAGHALVLGENRHAGKTITVSLSEEQRGRHIHLIGASGTGKSTLLLNLIVQDIEAGRGVGVLDPHGDLIDAVLSYIPAHRHEDVILFDPADDEYPVGFNILSAHSELEKTLLASDLAAIFRRFSTSFGDQMQAVLSNAILAILENERGGTLFDLRRFLTEKPFRVGYLSAVTDPEVRYYFTQEFPLLRGNPHASILTRLNTFLRPKPIRYMVAQREGIDFGRVMNGGQIFLAKLSHGLIGEENSHLLGALLVTKFHQLAMGRQGQTTEARRPFTLYIDEFHNFVTPSMAAILSAARKYRFSLVLAHQELAQLADEDARMASAVLTNPCTRICFRVGDVDARKLADGFSSFESGDLQSLGVGEAICRVERSEYDFTLRTALPAQLDWNLAKERRSAIVLRSRSNYGTPRAEVEKLLLAGTELPIVEEPRSAQVRQAGASSAQRTPTRTEPAAPEHFPAAMSAMTQPKKPSSTIVSTPTLGRGGREHKYLQHLLKRLAEDRGFRAVIEHPVLAGAGSVDLSLERGERRIACEICVSTEVEHELDNIQKCLSAGYETVVSVSTDAKVLRRLISQAEATLGSSRERVRFMQPEEVVVLLDEVVAGEGAAESTVRGYRVKRRFQVVDGSEAEARKLAIARVLGGASGERQRH